MVDYKSEFIEFLLSCGVLKFGDFTTKSGRKTPFFINTGEYKTGAQMNRLAQYYARAAATAFGEQFENLYGPAYKGIPLAVAVSMHLDREFARSVSYTFNRKEAKDHGEGGMLIGDRFEKPTRTLIIGDVITAGTSVTETMELLQTIPNVSVAGLLVSVNRMEAVAGGISALESIERTFGIQTAAIVTIEDIIAFISHSHNRQTFGIPNGMVEKIAQYRNTYGA